MKVYYQRGSNWKVKPQRVSSEEVLLVLSYNNWDDYNIKTTFNAIFYHNSQEVLEFGIKILIEGDRNSPEKLNTLCDAGWDGFFPIPDLNYVSVPTDIAFYEAILSKTGPESTEKTLDLIRDASYLVNIKEDASAAKLAQDSDFYTSLLREGGSRKAFEDGWRYLANEILNIQDFTMNLISKGGEVKPISFHFNSVHLPYDINVLIGINGVGKSFTLKSFVEYWLGVGMGHKDELDKLTYSPFNKNPNITRLILISYSPFEEFTINLSDSNLQDKKAYKYFGFRRVREGGGEGEENIGISRNLPASDSVSSIIQVLQDDEQFSFMKSWVNKLETIKSVLQTAITFDYIALKILSDSTLDPFKEFIVENNGEKYLIINSEISFLYDFLSSDIIDYKSGVIFIKNETEVKLSSGQRLFCYIVVNVVGQIRNNSLVIIDEPELFLHPSLEVEFISLLKKILKSFNSKAILATHSLTITREIPANCIHVYRQNGEGVDIDHPPFETFGGDMQRISSYVFGDNLTNKSFNEWMKDKLREFDNPKDLMSVLGTEINEEMIMRIMNSGENNGGKGN